jgi:hypothetical protein
MLFEQKKSKTLLIFCFAAAKLQNQAYPILGFAVQPASVREVVPAAGKKT